MSINTCCSLCLTPSSEYVPLRDGKGEFNDIYQTTIKYFDPMFLTKDTRAFENVKEHQELCQNCWRPIKEFYEFQQNVIKTRSLLDQIQVNPYTVVKVEYNDQNDVTNIDNNVDGYYQSDVDNEDEEYMYDNVYVKPDLDLEADYNEQQSTNDEHGDKPLKALRNETSKENKIIKGKKSSRKSKREVKLNDSKKKFKRKYASNLERARKLDAFIAEWKPELQCDLCEETASSFDILRGHFKEKHKTRFYIKCCERKFYRRYILVNHIQLHLNPDTHKCDICGKLRSNKHSLKVHLKLMHGKTEIYECEVCNKLFVKKMYLDRHMSTHVKKKRKFSCQKCGKAYSLEYQLKLHIEKVHNIGVQAIEKHLSKHIHVPSVMKKIKFLCDKCDVELDSQYQLKHHISVFHHGGSSSSACQICGKTTSNGKALLKHNKCANGKQHKFNCSHCDNVFKQSEYLREHIATHTGQDQCPQTLKVNAHMHYECEENKHSGIKNTEQYGETIHDVQTLENDLQEYADTEKTKFSCNECGVKLISRYHLKRHKVAFHRNGSSNCVCSICGKKASSTNTLLRHKNYAHKNECSKYVQENKNTHVSQNCFQCPHCLRKFKSITNMYYHRMKMHPVEWEEGKKNRIGRTHDVEFGCDPYDETIHDGQVLRKNLKEHTGYGNVDQYVETTQTVKALEKDLKAFYDIEKTAQYDETIIAVQTLEKEYYRTEKTVQCDETIHSKQALEKHSAEHTGIKKVDQHGEPIRSVQFSGIDKIGQYADTIHYVQDSEKNVKEYSDNEKTTFSCDECGVELLSRYFLNRHKADSHQKGFSICVCNVCGKKATSAKALLNHKKYAHKKESSKHVQGNTNTSNNENFYQCPHCPQTFKSIANMHYHRMKVHPVEWEEGKINNIGKAQNIGITCDQYGETTHGDQMIRKYLKKNTGNEKVDNCAETIQTVEALEKDLKEHSDIAKNVQCTETIHAVHGIKKTVQFAETNHAVQNIEKKKYSTKKNVQCDETVHSVQDLEKHLYEQSDINKVDHYGEPIHSVQALENNFNEHYSGIDKTVKCADTNHGVHDLENDLEERSDLEKTKFSCDECGAELISRHLLNRHKASFHQDDFLICVCDICGKKTSSDKALQSHKKYAHEKERLKHVQENTNTSKSQNFYQCPHCPQTFKSIANMHYHRMKVHPVEWEESKRNRLQVCTWN